MLFLRIKLKKLLLKKSFVAHASIVLGTVLAVVLTSFSSFAAVCNNIREHTLRLHVIANSDTQADQTLKLAVRDAVLKEGADIFALNYTKEQAVENAQANIAALEAAANGEIQRQGFNYEAKIYITNMYFATTYYDSATMPAGRYDAVRVEIGEAKGKNWWCVMYPPLCVPAALGAAQVEDVYGEKELKVIEGGYDVRFALLEIFETGKLAIAARAK